MADKRNPDFSEVPTLKEQGIDWTYTTWRGYAVPLKTPKAVVNKLIDAFNAVYKTQEFKDFMRKKWFWNQGKKWKRIR
jgi:tripartite-type tricarboxylate transporter receptor subunit TctC